MTSDQIKSPLRYPGSKAGLVDYFDDFIKQNLLVGVDFYEPYAGGASVSLGLLSRNLIRRTTLVERDPLIYAFWKCVKNYQERLCIEVQKLDVTLDTWKKFQKYLKPDVLQRYGLLKLAVAGLFFNRVNFSGIINTVTNWGNDAVIL